MTDSEKLTRAKLSLDGLSIGDAFGQQFFSTAVWHTCLESKELPLPVWPYTDDTVMALGILDTLEMHGQVEQDDLFQAFLRRYQAEPARGYGPGTGRLMMYVLHGADWRETARSFADGQGSFGNGAAMRVAPLGAYFSDDFGMVVEQARLSAEVTHTHPDGVAGAIAVAVAAAWVDRRRRDGTSAAPRQMIKTALKYTPAGPTREGIQESLSVPLDDWEHTAAEKLGNGRRITSADTVPFSLWCAAAHLDDFAAALWSTVRVGGDIDTNCAIVGGIVSLSVSRDGIPDEWRRRRESIGGVVE